MQEKSMQDLLKRLVSVMKSALSESDEVNQVVEQIEAFGFKVMLVADATIQPLDHRYGLLPRLVQPQIHSCN